jgi:carbamoyl-phosphate synthase large subunit
MPKRTDVRKVLVIGSGPIVIVKAMGFAVTCPGGTHRYLANKGIETEPVKKVTEGRPNIVDKIVESFSIRREALMHGVPYYTTVQAARMAVSAIEGLARAKLTVKPLQEYLKPAVE